METATGERVLPGEPVGSLAAEQPQLYVELRRNGQPVELLPTEMRLLEFMLRRPDQVLTKTMLLEGVWDLNFDPSTNLVEVHVSRLRRKLSQEGSPAPIQTMRGVGYMLGAPK
jgi:two-component system OmpR family response regulator